MKLLLTGMLLLASFAHASLGDEQTNNVKKALIVTVSQSNLDCTFTILNAPDRTMSNFAVKNGVLQLLNAPDTTVFIANDGAFSKITTVTKETVLNHEYVLNFKLSQNLKKIVNLNIERINKIVTEVNTGTVTNPKFETQIKKEYLVKGNCEVEY